MKKIAVLSFLFFCKTFIVEAQISLQRCIEMSSQHNPQAQLIPLLKESETVQILALTKNALPQASLAGQATWQSDVTGLAVSIPNFSVPKVPKDQYKATLDLTQSLWDGGVTKSQKLLVKASTNAETKNIENSLYAVREQVVNFYFGILLANKQIENTEITKNDLESQLKKQQANLQNGTAIKGNTMQLEARLIELKVQQREIRSRKLAALQGLSILTGKEFSENDILEEPKDPSVVESEIDRPELKYFEAQKEFLGVNKSVINAKYAPKINLFATGGYAQPGLNFLSPDFSPYFIGGLSLRIPLSHLYLKTKDADFKQININQAKVDKQRESFLQNLQIRLASQKEEIAKISDQIKEDAKLIEIRTYMKKTAEKKLENGIISLSDYVTELNNENMARQNLSLHQVQLLQGYENIKIITGK